MRDLNKVAEKMTALWSGGKSRKVKPTKQEQTTESLVNKTMAKYSKGKK